MEVEWQKSVVAQCREI